MSVAPKKKVPSEEGEAKTIAATVGMYVCMYVCMYGECCIPSFTYYLCMCHFIIIVCM